MTQEVRMFLDDADKTIIEGAVVGKEKIKNPFYYATELERQGKHKESERIYLELMNVDFNNSVLFAALGMNYAIMNKSGLGHALLTKALARIDHIVEDFERLGIIPKEKDAGALKAFIDGKKAEILNAMGTCWKHENHTDEARELFIEAQSLVPPNADIQNNIATLYINEGNPEKAMEYLESALKIDPDHAQSHWNRSLAYLELGDYARGWPDYDYGMRAKVRQDRNYAKETIPYWDGSPGKKVIVYGEQGIGDEILFASCLPDLIRDSELVVFDCHKKLHRLFCESFPGIDIYPTREDEQVVWPIKPDGTNRYEFDARVAIGSLPKFYRNKLEDFPGKPFIKPTDEARKRWEERLMQLPRWPNVGISWIGGHKRTRIEVRSIELENLLPILKAPVNWVSLQYTPAEEEIEAFEKKHGIKIHHWPEAVYSADYNDTAGLVANLDLVITVCTSVVHLAGSMGVPTWVMTPSRPAWRYRLDLDTMPWYKSVMLFRQERDSFDWAPVIADVAQAVADLTEAVQEVAA